jgi:Tfp pilus assembly protein PilN
MAIRLNLYHEVLRAKREQKYDPLKISFLALLVVSICLAVYYFIQLAGANSARAAYASRKAEFDRLTPLAKQAEARSAELTKQLDLAKSLTDRMEKRFYWAPVFESVAAAVPPHIQITKLSGDAGREGTRQCQLTLEGIAAGEEPRAAAEEMRRAIVERLGAKYASASAVFRSLDDSAESVRLNGHTLRTVVFSINATFKPEATPDPVPAQKPLAQRK